jgi:hypothetical protein
MEIIHWQELITLVLNLLFKNQKHETTYHKVIIPKHFIESQCL